MDERLGYINIRADLKCTVFKDICYQMLSLHAVYSHIQHLTYIGFHGQDASFESDEVKNI